tara:strand:- start:698 stop:1012 length:315 start_codon:yes stop_codon:yes gene_type:complete
MSQWPNRAWASVTKLAGGTFEDGTPKAELAINLDIQEDAEGQRGDRLGLPPGRFKAYLKFNERTGKYNGYLIRDTYDHVKKGPSGAHPHEPAESPKLADKDLPF